MRCGALISSLSHAGDSLEDDKICQVGGLRSGDGEIQGIGTFFSNRRTLRR